MESTLPKDYFETLACPACESAKLVVTKEKIIICENCLMGFRLNGDVPDFRLDHAINFKKEIGEQKRGIKAQFTVLMGEDTHKSFELKLGHCVVLGRWLIAGFSGDATVMVRLGTSTESTTGGFFPLDSNYQQLIERYLSSQNPEIKLAKNDPLVSSTHRTLGNFIRDQDFLLQDSSVSRTHVVLYQDERGVHVLDLFSKNGTYINGYEVELSRLKNNDVLSLGNVSLRVGFH